MESAEAQSCRFPTEGQQQLRGDAGEGGTQPSLPSRPQFGPGPEPRPPPAPLRAADERRERASRGGQPQPPSREMPQPRLPARRPGPAAPAAGTHLRLRRPGRPGRAPGRCVRLRPPRKVPTAPSANVRGPEQRPERWRQREQPTSGAAHPELLTDLLPLLSPPPPPPPPATSLCYRHGGGGVTAPPQLWQRQRARDPSAGTSSALGLRELCAQPESSSGRHCE